MYIIVDETKHTIPVKKTTQQYENEDYVDGVDVGIWNYIWINMIN